ncbi:DNA-(apurinic or apyrimidinic site) lyase, partial [Neodidymelliopsis sp. IMI 364377]
MAKKIAESPDSSLSPAPEDLNAPVETEVTVKATTDGKKRKAEATVKTTKRVKKEEVKEEEPVITGASEPLRKKRATTKKVKYEEDADDKTEGADGEAANVIEKTVKKKVTRAKKSKEPVPPLEERTTDTKLRIGAHVSVAG